MQKIAQCTPNQTIGLLTLVQVAFAVLVLMLTVPLPFTMTDMDGLAVAGIVASLSAALMGLYSGHRITHAICHKRWHHQQDDDVLAYERAWGLSVACHCLSLLATGLHVYFAVQIGANCLHDKPKEEHGFRPSCDSGTFDMNPVLTFLMLEVSVSVADLLLPTWLCSDVGILAGILPHVFGVAALIALGITSIIASVRVAIVVEDLVLGNHSDAPINLPHHVGIGRLHAGMYADNCLGCRGLKTCKPFEHSVLGMLYVCQYGLGYKRHTQSKLECYNQFAPCSSA
jgi:hypothetical protein